MNYRLDKNSQMSDSDSGVGGGFNLDIKRYLAGACAMIALLVVVKNCS